MNSISQLNHEGEFQRAWADLSTPVGNWPTWPIEN